MEDYYKEIENVILEREVNSKVRTLQDNKDTLLTNWTIGKLIVEAQNSIKIKNMLQD